MPDYSKGFQYLLLCKLQDKCYEFYNGSGTDFMQRRRQHKYCTNNPNSRDYNIKPYSYIRENGGWENWEMVIIEYYPCENRNELEKRERYLKELLGASLSKQIPTRTRQEWFSLYKSESDKKYRERNREKLNEQKKEYREKNREILKEKKKERVNCECGGHWTRGTGSVRHKKTILHQNYLKTLENE